MPVDTFERTRGPRRVHAEMRMSTRVRHNLLMDDWDISMRSILDASRKTDIVREERWKRAIHGHKQLRNEEMLKSLSKSFKNMFRLKRPKGKKGKEQAPARKKRSSIITDEIPPPDSAASTSNSSEEE